MKKFTLAILALALLVVGSAFRPNDENVLKTKTGHVWFFSKAPLENITAHNHQVASTLNKSNGDLAYSMLIKSFEFEKAKMQEHFNENYMESQSFPKATYKGKITDISKVNFLKDGTYNVSTTGNLTIHGVMHSVTVPGTIVVSGGKVRSIAKFNVALKDYNISIPAAVTGKIAENIEINVDVTYQ